MGGVPTEGPVETVSLPSGCEPSIPSWVLAAAPVAAPPFFFKKKQVRQNYLRTALRGRFSHMLCSPPPASG